jgi:hypothetical protein
VASDSSLSCAFGPYRAVLLNPLRSAPSVPPKSGTIATEDPNSAGFQTGPGEATEEHLFDGLSATSGSVGSGSIIDVCALVHLFMIVPWKERVRVLPIIYA